MKNFKSLTKVGVSLALLAGLVGAVNAADNDAAFVVSLQGTAKVSGERAFNVAPLTKLRKGEQVALDKNAAIQIVYLASNRKEDWKGAANFTVGIEKSESTSKPINVSSIPAAITNQIINTPDSAGSSRVGMVRLRATNELKLQEVDKNYNAYKQSVGQGNTLAEVYKLGELYGMKEYDMMADMVSKIRADNPGDHAVAELAAKYMTLVEAAKSEGAVKK